MSWRREMSSPNEEKIMAIGDRPLDRGFSTVSILITAAAVAAIVAGLASPPDPDAAIALSIGPAGVVHSASRAEAERPAVNQLAQFLTRWTSTVQTAAVDDGR